MGDRFSRIFAGAVLISLLMSAMPGRVRGAESNVKEQSIPRLNKVGAATQLFVGDKPLLILGGELGNSTPSDPSLLAPTFDKLQRIGLNAVMLPVYWDRLEPEEGKFDFSLVREAILQARAHQLHLVYLWFGTWKNSMSCYAPSWVKRDTARFGRARQSSGETMEIVTPQCQAARQADADAFAALMHWTRDFDANDQTVVMVQVENEIGMIPEPRDHSPEAEEAYRGSVPQPLLSRLAAGGLGAEINDIWKKAGGKTSGTWADVFGSTPNGQEIFQAWQIANYMEAVAQAGKRQYPLLTFANAALIRPGYLPGQYPSAGPLPHLLEIWRLAAPSLDMISPDIYFPNFQEWCHRYASSGNPLLIPEMASSARASGNAIYAAAQCNAIGFSPFAIENIDGEKERQLTQCYHLLASISPLILQCQQQQKVIGLSPQIQFDWKVDNEPQRQELGGIVFQAQFDRAATGDVGTSTVLPTLGAGRWEAPPGTPLGSAMILQLAPEEFLVVGMGVVVTFAPADGKGHVGIDEVQEGRYENSQWIGGRWLNGDETHQGRHVHLYDGNWTMQRVKLYRYE